MEKPQKTSSKLDDELKAVLPPSDKLMEDSIQWMRRHGKMIAIVFSLALVLLLVLWRQSHQKQTQWQEYGQLKTTWAQNPTDRDQVVDSLASLLDQHPDWMGSWKGLFLQSMLTLDRFDLLNKWLDVPQSRLLDPQATFSQAIDEATYIALECHREDPSFCIKQIDAWLASYHSSIDRKKPLSPMIFILQLAHLELLASKALLFEKQQEYKLEEEAWFEWAEALGLEKKDVLAASGKLSVQPVYLPWLQAHGKGRLTLLDYVRDRLSLLSKT